MESLKAGLKQLGVKGRITAYPMDDGIMILVLLNNAYFGTWDTDRKTFVG